MIKKTKTVYYCEYCNKHYIHKGWAKYHEKWCSKNPKLDRPCLTCYHLDVDEIKREHSHSMITSPKCMLKGKLLYNPRIERFEWFKVNGVDERQEPMPLTCDKFKSYKGI